MQFSMTRMIREGMADGDIGVVAARAGVGKSACLVQIAMAELLDGKAVLHVSLENKVSHVRQWYSNLITKIEGESKLPPHELKLQVEQNRHIHSYLDDGFTAERLADSHQFIREHMELDPKLVVIDGFPFEKATKEQLQSLAMTAKELKLQIWFSALTHRHLPAADENGLPFPLESFADQLDQVVHFDPESDGIGVRIWRRDRTEWTQLPIKLDPKTMLLIPPKEA